MLTDAKKEKKERQSYDMDKSFHAYKQTYQMEQMLKMMRQQYRLAIIHVRVSIDIVIPIPVHSCT